MLKTHIDILEDFDHELIGELKQLSEEHNFMIFEDRKFADIGSCPRIPGARDKLEFNSGNTVKLQYESGVHKIASWSDITNAHTVPGPSVVIGLKEVGLRQERKRGLLLLAEMSTKGSLAVDSYTKASVQMAMEHRDFVIGFIAQQRMIDASEGCDFLVLTPGVALGLRGDGMGQQYRTPEEVIAAGCDVIIVGRGIYETDRKLDVAGAGEKARQYQEAGWEAYSKSIGTQAEVSL